ERNAAVARELRPTLDSTWTKAQVEKARQHCRLVLATTNLEAEILDPIGGPGGCGIAAPVLVTAFGNMKANPPAKLNCNMALAVYNWTVNSIQPMARRKFGQSVIAVRNMSSYSCRSRRGVLGGRISEHSFGNALDVGGFTLSSGKKITVLKDWSSVGSLFGVVSSASFLTQVHDGACKDFSTVLGPAYNKAHRNHFHIDLGRGGRYKICH
ncbi:MAG TPA: extensin family protein, partial [Rhizobiales bacterium]|nr:extensin family protein [Hyphomicrobiales bacterium]